MQVCCKALKQNQLFALLPCSGKLQLIIDVQQFALHGEVGERVIN
jgi:hypothetical protein